MKIDMHVHSKHSGDSIAEPEKIVETAILRGLDGVVFTEHYDYSASEFVYELREKYPKFLIFRGVEYSAYENHILLYGDASDERLVERYKPIREVITIANELGLVHSVSHPYRVILSNNGMGGYREVALRDNLYYLKPMMLEGFNGQSTPEENKNSHNMAKRLGIPATGGSDAHHFLNVGCCYTDFKTPVTYDNFIDTLREGNFTCVDRRKFK